MDPPEVLVVLQDPVEPKINCLYICVLKISFLVFSSHLFQFFLELKEFNTAVVVALPGWGVLVFPV